jgi:hypothetical protein
MKPHVRSASLRLEAFEARQVPAVTIVNPHTATYTDVDGDFVTIKVSAGTLTPANFTTAPVGGGDQLQLIDFHNGGFDGANLTVTAKRSKGGDGLAAVGMIDSTSHDLGKVTIAGDLGGMNVGSNNPKTPALKSLTVRSIGRYWVATQGNSGTVGCYVDGPIGEIRVQGDVIDASLYLNVGPTVTVGLVTIGGSLIGVHDGTGEIICSGSVGTVQIAGYIRSGAGMETGGISCGGNLGTVSIGGSLIGGSFFDSGFIKGHDIGSVRIGGNVIGGSAPDSGFIQCGAKLGGATIGGSLIGGSGLTTGAIFSAGDMGTIRIGNDVRGGTNSDSGFIKSGGTLGGGKTGGVNIGGSLIGGSGTMSGAIESEGDIHSVSVGGDLIGGSIAGTAASLANSGVIESSSGRIGSVGIGGSIISGRDDSGVGDLIGNAIIRAEDDIGSLFIGGSIVGNSGPRGTSPVTISARGQHVPGLTDVAIGKLKVSGSVEFANILGGYARNQSNPDQLIPVNGDAQIGSVTVGGDWIASNLVAGVTNVASNNMAFGDTNDASIGPGNASIASAIGSVSIQGMIIGSPGSGDQYGFCAQQFGSFTFGGTTLFKKGNKSDLIPLSPITGDVAVHQVA